MLQHLPVCLVVLVYFHQCLWILRCTLVAQAKQLNHRNACAGLVLKVFLALLPWLLSIMGRLQGLHSLSSLDFSVISKFYIFQVRHASP